jgi:hypothetical protein
MLVNLTPHPIRLFGPDAGPEDAPVRTIEPSGTVARLATIDLGSNRMSDVEPYEAYELVEYGHAHDLPPRKDGVAYIVSLVVALAVHRDDLLAPYGEVRNAEGTMIGCRFLQKVC